MARLPNSACQWHQGHTRRIYEALGVRGKRFPPKMHGEYKIDGWRVVLKRGGKGAQKGKPRLFVRVEGRLYSVKNIRQLLCRGVRRRQTKRSRKVAARMRRKRGRFHRYTRWG